VSAPAGVEVARGREELLDAPRPLWLALRDHHHAIAPELGAIHDDEASWARRRAQYAQWLAEEERAFFLIARRGGALIAYVFARPVPQSSPTWSGEQDLLEIETLSVAPEARSTGIGAHLIALAREEVERRGYQGLSLVAVAANRDALRFYEREGFRPTFVVLRDTRRRR
jgi:ribosomal protein S18 acetylase RimI-like enzyme